MHEEPPHESAALAGDAGHDAREAPAGARDAGVDGASPAPLLLTTREALRELAAVASGLDAGSPVLFAVGPEAGRFNQGNPETSAHDHAIDRARCKEGLRGVTLQTEAQRAACHGKPNMVPVYRGADAGAAQACIDVFEYPNEACELPFVWGTPSAADRICHAEGKRLCTQDEWTLACAGDPEGGPDRVYAYGDTLDLTICNTNKPLARPRRRDLGRVDAEREKIWTTCGTETEPSGPFPRCRSSFGVFDQHGNVAEIMTRFEPADGEMKTQLKGSAFFYVDVAKKPTDPGGTGPSYPDHCNFDPRWHVEKLEEAVHMNYHLGFRCCLGL